MRRAALRCALALAGVLACATAFAQSGSGTAAPASDDAAAEKPGLRALLHDPKDGKFDMSRWLLERKGGFLPVPIVVSDPAVGYGGGSSRYEEEKRMVFHKNVGPLISMAEMSRCIHCTRCVRFGQEIAGVMELGMSNRGEHAEIATEEDRIAEVGDRFDEADQEGVRQAGSHERQRHGRERRPAIGAQRLRRLLERG